MFDGRSVRNSEVLTSSSRSRPRSLWASLMHLSRELVLSGQSPGIRRTGALKLSSLFLEGCMVLVGGEGESRRYGIL